MRTAVFVFLVLYILPLPGRCDTKNKIQPGSPPFQQKAEIIVQLRWHHQFQFAGYYAAVEKGFYAESGLSVRLSEGGNGTDTVADVLDGSAQYGVSNSEILIHRLKGKPLVVLAAIFQHSPLVLISRKETGINQPSHLIGKRVKIHSLSRDIEIAAMLQNQGIRLDQMHLIDQNIYPRDYTDKDIDVLSAYLTNEPFYLKEKNAAFNVIRPVQYGIDFYGDCLFTTEKELRTSPRRAELMRAASLKGWEYALKHTEEIIDILIKKYKCQKTRTHLQFEAAQMKKLIASDLIQIGHSNPTRWRHIADTLIKLKMVPSDASLDGFIYHPRKASDKAWMRQLGIISVWMIGLVAVFTLFLYYFNLKLRKAVRERTNELSDINRRLLYEINERRQAEQELQALHHSLEHRIKKRTAQLTESNAYLQNEIIEHKRTEAALAESENEKQAILNGIRSQLIFISPQEKILWVNQALLEEIEHREDSFQSPLSLIGASYQTVWNYSEKDCTVSPTAKSFESEKSEQGILETSDGRIWEKKAEPVFNAKNKLIGILEISNDITEKKQFEKQLLLTRKMEAVCDLAGGIAHQFNNSLFGITGNTELLQSHIQHDDKLAGYCRKILKSASYMSELTRQLLIYSSSTVYHPQPVSLKGFIENALSLFRQNLKEGIELMVELPSSTSAATISADMVQLKMAFRSILSNAAEAIHQKGFISITTGWISSEDRPAEIILPLDEVCSGYAFIRVEDNGKGMDDVTKDRIFEPFFSTHFAGRGLGMAAAYGIVRNHGGWIEVTSFQGKGSVIKIFLPSVSELRL